MGVFPASIAWRGATLPRFSENPVSSPLFDRSNIFMTGIEREERRRKRGRKKENELHIIEEWMDDGMEELMDDEMEELMCVRMYAY